LRLILTIAFVAVAGLFLGATTAWYSIQYSHRIGAINIGPWTAFPFAGATEVDPYTVARSVAEGTVPMGATEGLTFEAVTDSQGRALLRQCRYRIEGTTPPSKLWTLVTYDDSGALVPPAPGGISTLYSNGLLRFPDGSFLISVAQKPQPGNWLAVSGSGGMRLVLRLYDTSITSSAGSVAQAMPEIVRGECTG
jgi:hypothetical protein